MFFFSLPQVVLFLVSIVASCSAHGVNFQPSYYNGGNVTFGYDLMHKYPKITSIRIEIEPGVDISQAWEWIRQASEEGYDLIATYHMYGVMGKDDCPLGNDNVTCLLNAADWWVSNYDYLKQAGDFKINLSNEWGSHRQTAESFSSAYNQAIRIVRTVYPSGTIVIDVPGFGQETTVAAKASILLTDTNLTLSAHIYPLGRNQASQRWLSGIDMKELADTGRPCIIGEFGVRGYEGQCDVRNVINSAKALGFEVFAWAWNGDGDDLNMVSPSWNVCAQESDNSTAMEECFATETYIESDVYFSEMISLL